MWFIISHLNFNKPRVNLMLETYIPNFLIPTLFLEKSLKFQLFLEQPT